MFDERQWNQCVYRLGNLTLLEPQKNRDIGNATFDQKTEEYTTSRYVTTKSLGENPPELWTAEAIRERQRRMARRAAHVWRVDY
jgi:hypothetical protein